MDRVALDRDRPSAERVQMDCGQYMLDYADFLRRYPWWVYEILAFSPKDWHPNMPYNVRSKPNRPTPHNALSGDTLNRARALVAKQAEDDGLWFEAQTAPEAYLQQELRRLHALIEG